MNSPDFNALRAPFEAHEIEWRPQGKPRQNRRGGLVVLAVPYVRARAIMDRLDAACGPGGWACSYERWGETGVKCRISVKVSHGDGAEWIAREDGADETKVEPTKGGFSSALKRAAVLWGIGRYLYTVPPVWAACTERGQLAEIPQLPPEFLPIADASSVESQNETRAAQGGKRAAPTNSQSGGKKVTLARPESTVPASSADDLSSAEAPAFLQKVTIEEVKEAFRRAQWTKSGLEAMLMSEHACQSLAEVPPSSYRALRNQALSSEKRQAYCLSMTNG